MPRIPMQFHGPAQLSNAAATKFTVPAGERYVVRLIHVQNPSGAIVTFTLSKGADAAATRKWDAFPIPAQASGETENVKEFWVYFVFEAGEILQAFAGTNNILTITIVGERHIL